MIFKPHEVFSIVAKYLPENPVIIEAGAYDGRDTIKMAQQWPNAIIHAFEPVPDIFERLEKRTAHLPNVHRYPLALSNTTGNATFHISERPNKPGISSQAGSLLKPKERLKWSPLIFPRSITVKTITLSDWVEKNDIDHIDFLWLDMQGHELSVMKAAPDILKNVSVIFTEVGFIEGYEHQPDYKQVKKWLEQQGFCEIGRDFNNTTDWFFGNILFVKKTLLFC